MTEAEWLACADPDRMLRLLYREAASVFPFRPDWHRFAAFVVLNHLRDTSRRHVRGCWALDLVSGKE